LELETSDCGRIADKTVMFVLTLRIAKLVSKGLVDVSFLLENLSANKQIPALLQIAILATKEVLLRYVLNAATVLNLMRMVLAFL